MEEMLRGVWLVAGLTALVSGGGNAACFAGYRATGRGRRWGAGILALLNLGASLSFALQREWPFAIIYLGAAMIQTGTLWWMR